MRTRLLATSLALSALTVAPACGGEDPPGGLIVPFKIGADVPCSTLGVTEVTVDLVKAAPSGAEDMVIDSETVLCDEGQAEFMGVPAGKYDLRVSGIDAEKFIVVDNFDKTPADVGEVTSGAQNTADEVTLLPTPARILVRWQLNGGFGMCTDVPVTDFEVTTYEKDGLSELLSYSFACDPEEDPVEGYNMIVDPDRDIAGDDLDLITINPVDAQGNDLVAGPLRFTLAASPGLGRTVKLTALVDCSMDPCTIGCAQGKGADPMDPLECLPD